MDSYWPKIRHREKSTVPLHRQTISVIKGVYDLVDNQKPVLGNDPVVVVEYFNFYCSRCYVLDKSWRDVSEFLHRPIKHVQVPIILGDDQLPWAGIAWIAADQAGHGAAFKHAVFHAKFERDLDIGDKRVLLEIASGIGISQHIQAAFSSTKSRAAVEFRRGMDLKRRNKVTATPTVFINDNIRVLPGHTGDNTQLQLENIREILLDIQCRQYHACDL